MRKEEKKKTIKSAHEDARMLGIAGGAGFFFLEIFFNFFIFKKFDGRVKKKSSKNDDCVSQKKYPKKNDDHDRNCERQKK